MKKTILMIILSIMMISMVSCKKEVPTIYRAPIVDYYVSFEENNFYCYLRYEPESFTETGKPWITKAELKEQKPSVYIYESYKDILNDKLIDIYNSDKYQDKYYFIVKYDFNDTDIQHFCYYIVNGEQKFDIKFDITKDKKINYYK